MSDKRDSTKCPNPHRISVTNLLKEETLTFSLALLKGEIILPNSDASSFCNNYLTLYNLTKKSATNWPILKSKFKCLVDLERGENRIIIKYCTTCKRIVLNYSPRDTDHFVTPLYIICRNHSGEFQAPSECENSIDSACSRVVLGSKLIQCLIAEKLFENGFGRKTFQIEADVIDQIPYCIQFYSNLPVEEARKMDQEALWVYFGREIMKSNFSSTKRKFLAFLSATWWDGGGVAAHAALGGGGLALFGTGCLHTWPTRVEDVFTCFLDPTPVDTSRIMDDSCFRGTYGGCFSTTLGSVCHELGHTFDLGHSRDGIMGRGFDNIDMVFLPHSHCHKDAIQFATVQLISRLKVECFVTSLSRFNSPLRQPQSSNSSTISAKTNDNTLNNTPNTTKTNVLICGDESSQNSNTTIDSNLNDNSSTICEIHNSSPSTDSKNNSNSLPDTTETNSNSFTYNTSQNFNSPSSNSYTLSNFTSNNKNHLNTSDSMSILTANNSNISSSSDSNSTSNNENHLNTRDSMSTLTDNNSNISSSIDSTSNCGNYNDNTSNKMNAIGSNERNSNDTSDCVNDSKTDLNYTTDTSINGNRLNTTSNTCNHSNTSSRAGNSSRTSCNINYNAKSCNLLNNTSGINSNTSSNNYNRPTVINKSNNSSPVRQPTNINSNTSSNRSNTSKTNYTTNNSTNSATSNTSNLHSNTSRNDYSNVTSNNVKNSNDNPSFTSKASHPSHSPSSSPSITNKHSNTSINTSKTPSNNSNHTSNCCKTPSNNSNHTSNCCKTPSNNSNHTSNRSSSNKNSSNQDSPRRSTNSPNRLVANCSPSRMSSTNRNKRNNNVLVVQQQIKNKDSDSVASGVDDRTYWTPSCATLLAYHKWFNCAQGNRDELKYNAVRGLVTSSAGLRVVELRGEESLVLHSWQFTNTGARPKTQLVVPKQISARAQLIVVEDNNGNIIKQDLTTTTTAVANNSNNNV